MAAVADMGCSTRRVWLQQQGVGCRVPAAESVALQVKTFEQQPRINKHVCCSSTWLNLVAVLRSGRGTNSSKALCSYTLAELVTLSSA
jgi:hypothetical protein